VGADLLAIPTVVERITHDFDALTHSANRLSAWTFTSKLRSRLRAHKSGRHDGSVDLLITGCESSLWLGEQFASDLALVYPRLKIVTLSANKLLGQLGQRMPIPQIGFSFSSESHSFRNSIILVLTHSGGTYAPLLCCSLLKGFTSEIFVVTSELDTQAARAVRSSSSSATCANLTSQYLFCTHAGFRPAEASSLSVVAMHHLLSQLLLFLMGYLSHFEHGESSAPICGSQYEFEEVRELAAIGRLQADALRELVGDSTLGDTPTSAALRSKGRSWAQHVLEGPRSWLLSATYIAVTVFLGTTPLNAAVSALVGHTLPSPLVATDDATPTWLWSVRHVVALAAVIIYSFLGWWIPVVIRLAQGRPWLHRVAGRSVLIGDVPWVAQCVEQFASKLFALSYSIASCSFASANPADHLVHRHTHRVVRGSLLAVGRPDGRANALTTAEAACSLAVNQASSIQNLGVTCESITIGHSPFKLPLSADHLELPTARPPFMCEVLQQLEGEPTPMSSKAASKEPTLHGGGAFSEDQLNSVAACISRSRDLSRESSTHGGAAGIRSPAPAGKRISKESMGSGFCSHAMLLQRLVDAGVPMIESRDSEQAVGAGMSPLERGEASGSRARQPSGERSASRGRSAVRYFAQLATQSAHDPSVTPSTAEAAEAAEPLVQQDRLLIVPLGLPASPVTNRDKSHYHASPVASPGQIEITTQSPSDNHIRGGANFGSTPPAVETVASAPPSPPLTPPPIMVPIDSEMKSGSLSHGSSWASRGSTSTGRRRVSMTRLVTRRAAPPSAASIKRPPKSLADTRRDSSPNVVKAALSRLGKRSRKVFDRASGPMNSESFAAFQNAVFQIEPLSEPFLGAWMKWRAKYASLTTDELMRRQQLVQVLSETRFDALQRLVSFFVLFHAMGKAVADWWSCASFGTLSYDCSRSQSIMRVATTASPVSGMEVRERMVMIHEQTRREQAAASVQRIWRSVRLKRWVMKHVRK
jgi:hypothetical protein